MKDPEYVVFKDAVVRKEPLNQIKEKLVTVEKYGAACGIIEEAGLSNPDEVLAKLGFKIKWKGLDMGAATIDPCK